MTTVDDPHAARIKRSVDAWRRNNYRPTRAALEIGIPERTLQDHIKQARSRGLIRLDENHLSSRAQDTPPSACSPPPPQAEPAALGRPDFTAHPLVDEELTDEELVDYRKRITSRKIEAHKANKVRRVNVNIDGPIAITHFGDPHVDDDGCNITLLERHMETVQATEGMFAGNLGDLHNNWVGRLARLYANQSTTAKQAAQLVRWMLRKVDWLYVVLGNHDIWQGGDLAETVLAGTQALVSPHGLTIEVFTPSGRVFTVNARHDYKGRSQYGAEFGAKKAAKFGQRYHVLVAGHIHASGYGLEKDPKTGLISHCMRVGSYKVVDDYADEHGFPDEHVFVAPTTIFDPRYPDDDPRCVTTIFDPEKAASYLTFLRVEWKREREVEHRRHLAKAGKARRRARKGGRR